MFFGLNQTNLYCYLNSILEEVPADEIIASMTTDSVEVSKDLLVGEGLAFYVFRSQRNDLIQRLPGITGYLKGDDFQKRGPYLVSEFLRVNRIETYEECLKIAL